MPDKIAKIAKMPKENSWSCKKACSSLSTAKPIDFGGLMNRINLVLSNNELKGNAINSECLF